MTNAKYLRMLLLAALVVSIGNASSVVAQSRNYTFYSIKEGLPSSTVYATYQSKEGFMWLATSQGVSRYDGQSFQNYSIAEGLPDSEIFNFYEDSQGRLWFYTFNGKAAYYKDGNIYNASNDTTLALLKGNSRVVSIFEDNQKNLWYATFLEGITQLKPNGQAKYCQYPPQIKSMYDVFLLPSGNVRGHIMNRMVEFKAGRLCEGQYFDVKTQKVPMYGGFIKHVLIDEDTYWACNYSTILSYSLSTDSVVEVFKKGNQKININNLSKTKDEVWVCTSKGAYKHLGNYKLAQPILREYEITSVYKDHEGSYWIGTTNDGVIRLPANEIYGFHEDEHMKNINVTSLFLNESGKVWYATRSRYYGYLAGGEAHNIDLDSLGPRFDSNMKVTKLIFQKEGYWKGFSGGIAWMPNQGKPKVYHRIMAKDLFFAQSGDLWLASSVGLYVLNKQETQLLRKGNWQRVPVFHHAKVIPHRVHRLHQTQSGHIWIAGQSATYKKCINTPEIKQVHSLDGLRVNDFASHPTWGLLLATNGAGLGYIGSDGSLRWVAKAKGLSSNIVTSVAVSENGNIWLGTNKGLNRLSGNPDQTQITYITQYNGLSSDIVNDVLTIGDSVWAATENGLDVFNQSALRASEQPPYLVFEKMIVNGAPIDMRATKQLHYRQNSLVLSFKGISFNSSHTIQYRYRISGQSDWQYTAVPTVQFPALSPDDYTFLVAAKAQSGGWSSPQKITFTIARPYWQSWPFLLVMSLIAVSVTGLGFHLILKRKQHKERQVQKALRTELKSLKAQMNPHFMFNALNSIQGELLSAKPDVAHQYIIKLSRLLRKVLDYSDCEYITVAQEVAMITDYLDIEQLKTGGSFQYLIEVSEALDDSLAEVPTMIIQPFLENALWHGLSQLNEARELKVGFGLTMQGHVEVRIADNGIGRANSAQKTKKSHQSKGLALVTERLDILNYGKPEKILFHINDVHHDNAVCPGTVVTLTIPQ